MNGHETGSWRVVHQRHGWLTPSVAYFHRADAMHRHVEKLLGDGRPDLAPLVLLRVDRRPVGEWAIEQILRGGGDA